MSFGNKVGRALGVVGALAIEGTVRGATGLGQFGADVVAGAEDGYAEKHAALLITREAVKVKRAAFAAQLRAQHDTAMQPGPMTVAPEPAPAKTHRGRVALG